MSETEYSYPYATTGREEACFVKCQCGRKSYGTFFGTVKSHIRGDAWYEHRIHMDKECPERRAPRKRGLREALSEIQRILDAVPS